MCGRFGFYVLRLRNERGNNVPAGKETEYKQRFKFGGKFYFYYLRGCFV